MGRTALPPLPPRDSPEFERLLLERAQLWLNARGRDAEGLIAVADLTPNDYTLRKEVIGKFPNVAQERSAREGA